MKPSRIFLAAAASVCALSGILSGPIQAQTATTDPVGFITITIAAGTSAHPTQTLAGLGLTQPVAFQGTADAVGTNSITINSAPFTANQFNSANGPYYLEVTNGNSAGVLLDIASTTTTTITTVQNLPAGSAAGLTFKVRPHWTIGAVFGANNSAGLGTGSLTTADLLLLENSAGTGFNTYFYQIDPSGGGNGWRSADDLFTDASGTVILPEQAIVVKTRSAGAQVVLTGAVKLGQTTVPIFHGANYMGNICATAMTLSDSGLYTGNSSTGVTGGLLGGSPQVDQVLVQSGSGYNTYFYQVDPSGGGTGWRSADDLFTDVGTSVSIPVGTGIIIKRAGTTGFNWVIPQHPTSVN